MACGGLLTTKVCVFIRLLLSCVVISLLECSSLQMFYSANCRHAYIIPPQFLDLQCAEKFAQEKKCVFLSKFSKFSHGNRNRDISIVLNHHNLERIHSANNIWIFISVGWAVRPLGIHISGKYLDYSVYGYKGNLIRNEIVQQLSAICE